MAKDATEGRCIIIIDSSNNGRTFDAPTKEPR